MTGSVILAFIGEMFGMAPYFVVTLLAKELYEALPRWNVRRSWR